MKSYFGAELLNVEVTRERVILDLQNEPDRVYWQNSPEVSGWIKTYDEDSGDIDKAQGFKLSVEFSPQWGICFSAGSSPGREVPFQESATLSRGLPCRRQTFTSPSIPMEYDSRYRLKTRCVRFSSDRFIERKPGRKYATCDQCRQVKPGSKQRRNSPDPVPGHNARA